MDIFQTFGIVVLLWLVWAIARSMPSSSDLNNLDDKLSKLQREIESIRTESEEQYDELITAIERLSDRQPPSTGLDAVMFESLDDWKSRIDAYKQQKEDFKNKPDE